MKYQDSSGLSQEEISNWDYDEAQKKAEEEAQLEQQRIEEQLPPSTADSLPSEDHQGPTVSNADVARTTEKAELESGAVTQVGQAIDYVLDGGIGNDALNALAAGANALSGGRLQGLDDAVLGYEEMKERETEIAEDLQRKREDGEMSGVEQAAHTLANATTGLAEGAQAGLQLPTSLVARVANQAAPWSDPPEALQNSPVGSSVFKIAEVMVPTLLTAGVAGPMGGLGGLATESAIETVPQRAGDDLIAGQQIASAFGDIADHLGMDGEELTADIMRGDNLRGQGVVAVVGFIQNFGINFGIDKVVKYFSRTKAVAQDQKLLRGSRPALPRKPQPRLPGQKGLPAAGETSAVEEVSVIVHPADPKVGKIMNEAPEEISRRIDDTVDPGYTAGAEPADVIDVDTFVPTSKPSQGNTHVSEEAMIREIVTRRNSGIGRDGLTDADRAYFTNWSAITDDKATAEALEEITRGYRRLRDFPSDVAEVKVRAADFWKKNRALLNDDVESFARKMYDEGGVKPLDGRTGMKDLEGLDWKRAMREEMMVDEEGFTVLALAAEQLGVQTTKMARMLKGLEFGSLDFTNAMDVFVKYHEKTDLLMIPLRRGKRKWAAEGFAQQGRVRKNLENFTGSERVSINRQYPSAGATANDFTTIGLNEANPGATLGELWSRYKAGDSEAGDVLKAYMDHLAMVTPDMAHQSATRMTQVVDQYLKKQGEDTFRSLWYASMLTTTEPIKAAVAGSVLQNGLLAAADVAQGAVGSLFTLGRNAAFKQQLWYGYGKVLGALISTKHNTSVFFKALKENKMLHNTSRFKDLDPTTLAQKQLQNEWAHKTKMDELERTGGTAIDKFRQNLNYLMATVANHPATQVANRTLMAVDQASISTTANMESVGQAFAKAFQDGKLKDVESYIDNARMSMFADGVRTGKVTDPDVMAAARNLSLQSPIYRGDDATKIDRFFAGAEDAAAESAVWKFFNPFVRLSWNALDLAGKMEPTGYLSKQIPRYRRTIAGEFGPAQQNQLKSFIAAGRLVMLGATMPVLNGNVIGHNPPPGMEEYRNSFIVPDGKGGFTAYSFERYQPFAAMLSTFADVVNGAKQNLISTQQLDVYTSQILLSLSMSLRGQTFLQGLDDMSNLFSLEGADKKIPQFLAELAAIPVNFGGGLLPVKQATRALQPYETIGRDRESTFEDMLRTISQRALGGIGNPVKHNRYTGEAKTKAGPNGVGYWEATRNNLAQIFGYAGPVKTSKMEQPIQEVFEEVQYPTEKWDKTNTVKSSAGTLELNADEISELDRLTGDPEVGNIQERIIAAASSVEYQNLLKEYRARVAAGEGGAMDPNSEARQILAKLHRIIDTAHNEARSIAVDTMIESGDYPDLAGKADVAEMEQLISF